MINEGEVRVLHERRECLLREYPRLRTGGMIRQGQYKEEEEKEVSA